MVSLQWVAENLWIFLWKDVFPPIWEEKKALNLLEILLTRLILFRDRNDPSSPVSGSSNLREQSTRHLPRLWLKNRTREKAYLALMLVKFPLLKSLNCLCRGLVPTSLSAYVPVQTTKRQQSMPKPIANPIIIYLADQGMPNKYIYEHIYWEDEPTIVLLFKE